MSKGSKVWKSETIKTRKHWAVGTVWNVRSSNGKDVYDIDFNVPLDVEVKIGNNWLDMGLA